MYVLIYSPVKAETWFGAPVTPALENVYTNFGFTAAPFVFELAARMAQADRPANTVTQ